MNKLLKTLLILFSLVILLSGCDSRDIKANSKVDSPNNSTVMSTKDNGSTEQKSEKIALNMESEHFILYSYEKDKVFLQDLSKALESGFGKVTKDLNCKLNGKTTVKVYPDTVTFHIAIGKPNAPWWYVGEGSGGVISITSDMSHVSPSNVVVHELTHIITNSNFGVLPEWLFQGIAMFEGKDTPVSTIESAVRSGVKSQNIPSLKDLNVDYWSFADKGGYNYSYVAVEFIIKEFGYDKLNKFLRSPYDYKNSFGLTEDELNGKWVEYLKINYN